MKTSHDQLHSVESHTMPADAEGDCKIWLNKCYFHVLGIRNRAQGTLAEIQIAVVGGAACRESVHLKQSIARRLSIDVGKKVDQTRIHEKIILEGGS
jgi:hypothetical protein